MTCLVQFYFLAAVALASGTAIIDSSLQKRFIPGDPGSTQSVMISFTQGIQSVIQKINGMNFSSMGEKRTALTNAQETFTNAAQAPLQSFLKTMSVPYESFWINNKMVVQNVNSGLVQAMSGVPGVASIEPEPVLKKYPVLRYEEDLELSNMTRLTRQSGGLAWGVEKIKANQVWRSYKGKGVVVAGIDTGVLRSHEALRGNWRTQYGWLDPYTRTPTPTDDDGHGTHTMGTIVGTNGIGVAPEATWIACRGCNTESCGGSQLMRCGQWVQCPTDASGRNKNCDYAPDIVSNSWGGPGGRTFYDDIISSWRSVGIIPVFAIGNEGPSCSTTGSPGDRPNVIGVGSMDQRDTISSFSSLGPTSDRRVKPDIVAPGGRILSALPTSDTAYGTLSGTSMACPHVSGVIALMRQKDPTLTYDEAYSAITESATTSSLKTSRARTCGGRSASRFPNNVFGYGYIDSVAAVNAV